MANFPIGQPRLKARAQRIHLELHPRIGPVLDQAEQVAGVLLGEDPRGEDLRVQGEAGVLIRLLRLERRADPIGREGRQDLLGVVGEVHDHHLPLAGVAAVQSRDRLHRVAPEHRLIEEHTGE